MELEAPHSRLHAYMYLAMNNARAIFLVLILAHCRGVGFKRPRRAREKVRNCIKWERFESKMEKKITKILPHIFWKVEREERMDPPIHTLYCRSGGATTLILTDAGARDSSSFCTRAAIPANIVEPIVNEVKSNEIWLENENDDLER